MGLRPATRTGRWSVWLLVAFAAGFAALMTAIAAGEKGGDTIADNWLLGGPGLVAAAGGIGAFFAGIVAILRYGERSPSVTLAAAVAAVVTLWIALEIALPH